MPQVLFKDAQKLIVDTSYADFGEPAKATIVGGVRFETPYRPPLPMVNRRGDFFFYDDGAPVSQVEHLAHLPTREVDSATGQTINPKALAEAQVARLLAGQVVEPPPPPEAPEPRPQSPMEVAMNGGVVVRRQEPAASDTAEAVAALRTRRPSLRGRTRVPFDAEAAIAAADTE